MLKRLYSRIETLLTKTHIPTLAEGRPDFRRACYLSVLAHVAWLFVLAALVPWFDSQNTHSAPLIFDYVFAPTEEVDRSSLSDLDAAEATRTPRQQVKSEERSEDKALSTSSTLVEKGAARQYRSNPKISEEDSQLASHESQSEADVSDELTTNDESEPRFVPQQPEPDVIDPELALTALKPTTIDFPKSEPSKPELLPAKVAMNRKQNKMMRKRFRKWAENLYKMDLPDSSIVWKHKGQVYSARVRTLPAETETDIEEVLIEVSTEEDGYTLSSEMRMRRLAFSNFAQFVDYWDPRVAVHDDVLKGRFHTNTTFNVSQSYGVKPKFHGKVTTASYEVKAAGTFPFMDRKSIFVAGIETGVKEIRLPKNNLPFAQDSEISERQIRTFSEETWIEFKRDGSLTWKTGISADTLSRQALPKSESFYIIGSKKKKLHLKGVIDGMVMVYSPGKIVIDGSLTYLRHPELVSGADDYLGIVSDKDIEIAHPRVTGPGNLYIYASIYAKGRFKVPHLRGNGEATLYIYGSLTAGSLTATEPRYSPHIQFDKRLEGKRPPNFPMTDRYEVTDWDGRWEVKRREGLNR
ncbi:hypothetical protein MJD09_25060 [bacterium]|nr:hypothetical protein [bacterium]